MLSLVHRSPFRPVFLVFVLVLSGSISAVRAAAPTPTPTPTPGQLDTTFVPAPGTNDAVNVVIPQPDGKVIAAGRFTFANNIVRNRIARFNFNGSLDTTFDPGTGADGEITAAVLQSDGRIIVAGRFTSFNGFIHNGICRLNADGSVDQRFGLGSGINVVLALALQSDGRIIVGGQFSNVDFTPRSNLARLNTDGSVDLSFDPGSGPSGDVNAIVIQSDGAIVIGGTFTGYNGFARGGVARVLGNGALDPSFDSSVGTGGNVFALALQHNGQIVLGGHFVQYIGNNRTYIARVFGDGSLDFGFNPAVPNDWVQSLAVEPDDRILVGGFFTDVNGFGRNRIARLNTNGSVDLTFDPGAGCLGSPTNDATQVRSIALQQFGRVLAGGVFTSYDTQPRDNIVRLFDSAALFQNLSARAHVFTGERILIAGFIIGGTENKTVLLRGVGPALAAFGVPTPLADPTLSLYDHTGALLAANDNWKDTQKPQIQATGLAPSNDFEAAILISLSPGAYTAFLQGKAMTTGIGLAEVYDVDPNANAQPTNLSARAFVGTGNDVLIGGTIIGGNAGSLLRVLVRALGPSLASFGVATPLADPTLSLRDANGNVIANNDNWKDSQQQADIAATGKAPPNDHESAILALLAPGNYTAIVAGKNGTTGVALMEFYSLP